MANQKKSKEGSVKTSYPNIDRFIKLHAQGGKSEHGKHFAEILTEMQTDLLAHPGELMVVAQYDMPSHHRTEHSLANTQIALIPKQCLMTIPPKHLSTVKEALAYRRPILQIPVKRYVSITQDRPGKEYMHWCRRNQPINLTAQDIVSIDRLYRSKERGYGLGDYTVHIGNTEVEMWLIPATWRCSAPAISFYSNMCDAIELLGMSGQEAMQALDHFFTSFRGLFPKEFDDFMSRNNLSCLA